MPLMGWDAFCDAHYRPFTVRADLDASGPQTRFESLQRLIKSMDLTGNYALYRGEDFIRVAFELEADAAQVVRTLNAHKAAHVDQWAGQWVFPLDGATTARIKSLLRPFKRSPGL